MFISIISLKADDKIIRRQKQGEILIRGHEFIDPWEAVRLDPNDLRTGPSRGARNGKAFVRPECVNAPELEHCIASLPCFLLQPEEQFK